MLTGEVGGGGVWNGTERRGESGGVWVCGWCGGKGRREEGQWKQQEELDPKGVEAVDWEVGGVEGGSAARWVWSGRWCRRRGSGGGGLE